MSIALIYALLAIIPGLLLIVMALFSFDGDADIDVDHDIDLDHDMEMDHDISADAGGGPSRLGLKLIFSFIVGFGVTGFLDIHYEWPIPHIIAAVAGGAVTYYIVYRLLKLLYSQQANSQISSSSVIGEKAIITSVILQGSTGEIQTQDPKTGQTIYLRAQAIDQKKEFQKGDEVTIKSVTSGLAKIK